MKFETSIPLKQEDKIFFLLRPLFATIGALAFLYLVFKIDSFSPSNNIFIWENEYDSLPGLNPDGPYLFIIGIFIVLGIGINGILNSLVHKIQLSDDVLLIESKNLVRRKVYVIDCSEIEKICIEKSRIDPEQQETMFNHERTSLNIYIQNRETIKLYISPTSYETKEIKEVLSIFM